MSSISQLVLFALFLIASTSGLHHTNHGSFKGKLSPSITNLRESMTAKINKLRHATAERLRSPHFAFMGAPDLGNLSNLTNATNITRPGDSSDSESWWDRFVNWLKGIFDFDSIVKLFFLVASLGLIRALRESPHEKIRDIRRQLLTAVDPFGSSTGPSSVNLTATNEAIEKSDETAWQWGFWPFTAIPDDNLTVAMVPPDQK